MKVFVVLVGVVLILGGLVYAFQGELMRQVFQPTESVTPEGEVLEEGSGVGSEPAPPEVVAENLRIPWELVFLPNGDMLVTERPGTLLRIGENRQAIPISGVLHRGEGGLLGLALHPRFSENNWIYLYLTTSENERVTNRVERYTLNGTTLSDRKVIIENIPGASYHDGGRIAFGADQMLYIATGDAGVTQNAQDTESLAGKILRVTDEGTIPAGNPFENEIYSYGHRNVQGLAWDTADRLWATEHGPSGGQTGYDELNRIIPGGNYGWPNVKGDETNAGMTAPELHSGADETWAPSGMTFISDYLLFVGLRGESLYAAQLVNNRATNLKAFFRGEYGRLRTVVLSPDGMLYLLTNNTDGRGSPQSGDDKIIKIDPKILGL